VVKVLEEHMSKGEKDLAKELWEHRHDPGEWSEEAEDIEVKPRRSSVVSFRLPPGEFAVLEQARAQTGESLSEFIRNALALRLHRSYGGASAPMLGTLGITYGAYSGLSENDPNEILMNHIADSVGLAVIEGIGTKSSYVSRHSQGEPLKRMLAID
jgi:hypothetical protein